MKMMSITLLIKPLKKGEVDACTKFVSPLFGFGYILGKDEDGPIWENEAELLGHTGIFTKDTAIICGGQNGDGDVNACYEWDFMVNRYVTIPCCKIIHAKDIIECKILILTDNFRLII